MNDGGSVFKRLNEIGLDSVLEERGHSALRRKIAAVNGFAVIGVCHENVAKSGLEIVKRLRKAENSHDLAGNSDHKMVLTWYAVHRSSKSYGDVTERTVVCVCNAGENYASGVY